MKSSYSLSQLEVAYAFVYPCVIGHAQGLHVVSRQQRKSSMHKSEKSQQAHRFRRVTKTSETPFTSENAKGHPPEFNAEHMGVPTALAS